MAITIEHINKAIGISKKYNVIRLILFGSALEDFENASDLDLACEGIHDWNFFRLAAELEEQLKINIDLVSVDDDSRFSQHIKKIGKVLYERDRVN